MLAFSRLIDRVNTYIGKAVSWLILVAVLFAVYNAVVRKFPLPVGIDIPFDKIPYFESARASLFEYSNAWVDAQWMLFACVFLFCAPWTMLLNEHIRIDVFNEKFKPRTRYIIDIIGHAFVLIPFCAVMVWISWPWAMKAYGLLEVSDQAGGLPRWPAKFMVPFAFALLGLQGISELTKRIYQFRGLLDDPHAKHHHSSFEEIATEAAGQSHE